MKPEIRAILRDIQAAARIGHTESLWAALDGLLDLPALSGNRTMDEATLSQVVLPVAGAIAGSRLNHAALRPLIGNQYAVFRAVAGAALAEQFLKGSNGTRLNDLKALSQDPRRDVLEAIRRVVLESGETSSDRQEELYEAWMASPSPRTQTLAIQILPNLPQAVILEKIEHLKNGALTVQPEVKKALGKVLAVLGAGGHAPQVLAILSAWARKPEPDSWLICASLSKPWASEYAEESLAILTQLATQTGPKKRIRKVLESLHRNGAKDEVAAALQQWRMSDHPNLRGAGNDPKIEL
jgi:hypothetical protein